MKRVSSAQLGVVLAAGAAVLLLGLRAAAQPTSTAPGFSFPYKKNGLLQALFTGASAKPVNLAQPTLLVVEQFRVETFREDGTPDLTGTAPKCLLNVGTKDASSAGPLTATQADGQFSLGGEGFRWDHESGRLTISNKFHFRLRADAFNATGPSSLPSTQP